MKTSNALNAVDSGSQPKQSASPETEQKIRDRAYELYLERGMQDGFAERDWLQAETEILNVNATLKAAA